MAAKRTEYIRIPYKLYLALRRVANIMTVVIDDGKVLFLTSGNEADRVIAALKVTNP